MADASQAPLRSSSYHAAVLASSTSTLTPPPPRPAHAQRHHALPTAAEAARRHWRAVADALTVTTHIRAARLAEARNNNNTSTPASTPSAATGEGERGERDEAHLASPAGAVRSLTNAAVSGGLLALAFEVPRSGVLASVLLLLVAAALLNETLRMLYAANVRFGTSSYTGAARRAWGLRGLRAVTVSLGLGQFGLLASYATVLETTLPLVVQHAACGCVAGEPGCDLPWYLSSAFLVVVLMLAFIAPISLRSDPDVFARISFTTFVHFFLLVCLVVYGVVVYSPSNQVDTYPALTRSEVRAAGLSPSGDLLPPPARLIRWGPELALTFVVAVFAMEAHSSGLPILFGTRHAPQPLGTTAEAAQAARTATVRRIIGLTFGGVVAYYLVVMLGCYMAFGGKVDENSLNSFPSDDPFSLVVRATYAFELGTSIPIFAYAMRRDLTAAVLGVEGNQAEMDGIEAASRARTAGLTLAILALATALGLAFDLSTIVGITGSLATAPNCLIFPALLHHRAVTADGSPASRTQRLKTGSFVALGVLLSGLGLYQQLTEL